MYQIRHDNVSYLYLLEWDSWVICKASQYQIIVIVGGTVAIDIKEFIILVMEVIYCLCVYVVEW